MTEFERAGTQPERSGWTRATAIVAGAALVATLAPAVSAPPSAEAVGITLSPTSSVTYTDTAVFNRFDDVEVILSGGTPVLQGPEGPAVTAVDPPNTASITYTTMAASPLGTLFLRSDATAFVFAPNDDAINRLTSDQTVEAVFTFDADQNVRFTVTAIGADDAPVLDIASRDDITADLPGIGDDDFVACGTSPGTGFPYQIADGSSPDGERCHLAFDGSNTTKYLNFGGAGTSLLIDATRNYIVNGLQLTTANDDPERDPATFTLLGSNTSLTANMSTIATGALSPPTARGVDFPAVSFANALPYRYYQLRFDALRGPGTPAVQVSRIRLPGVRGEGAPTFVVGGAPVHVEPEFGLLHPDHPAPDITGVTVSVPGAQVGDALDIGDLPSGITVSGEGSATLTLSGAASAAAYATALSRVTFAATGHVGERPVRWVVTDAKNLQAQADSRVIVTDTAPAALPSVVTSSASGITTTGALLEGEVTADGGSDVSARGFVVSTSGVPSLGGAEVTEVPAGAGVGAFSAEVTGLEPSTEHAVRAYATNASGTRYGTSRTVTTLTPAPSPPPPTPVKDPEPDPLPDAPVRTPEGNLPNAPTGSATGQIGDQPTDLTVRRVDATKTEVTGPGFGMQLETDTDAEQPNEDRPGRVDPDAVIALSRGDQIRVSVRGFAPQSPVRLWLLSEPLLLGDFETNATGALDEAATRIDEAVSACPHTLHVVGRLPDGGDVAMSLGVWVTADPTPFADLPAGVNHARAAACLSERGIVDGFRDGSFGPHNPTTRGQAAAVLSGALGLDEDAAATLPDTIGTTHEAAIAAMLEAGLMQGFTNGGFGPNQAVTRGQLASVLAAALGLPDGDDTATPFDDDVGSTHASAIAALHAIGAVRGFNDQTFRPEEPVTRGQLASMTVRLLARLETN